MATLRSRPDRGPSKPWRGSRAFAAWPPTPLARAGVAGMRPGCIVPTVANR
jgi:hypothetical protein